VSAGKCLALESSPTDVQTTSLQVSPRYAYDRTGETPPRIVGYTASNQVRVKVRTLGSLGSLLDQVVKSGANRLEGVSFSSSEPDRALNEARRRAVADARRRAELYAQAAGVGLVRPLRIQEQAAGIFPRRVFAGLAAARAAAAVPVAPGEQGVAASVTVTYEMGYRGKLAKRTGSAPGRFATTIALPSVR